MLSLRLCVLALRILDVASPSIIYIFSCRELFLPVSQIFQTKRHAGHILEHNIVVRSFLGKVTNYGRIGIVGVGVLGTKSWPSEGFSLSHGSGSGQ